MRLFARRQLLHLQKSVRKRLLLIACPNLFLIAVCLNTTAEGFTQQVTISQRDVTLERVFNEIYRQTGYTFVYTESLLEKGKTVSINVGRGSLKEVLDGCFKDQPFNYTILNRMVVIKDKKVAVAEKESITAAPPPVTITGRIINSKGEPLAGVSVLVSGSKTGTTTNNEGRFTITLSNNKNIVLQVSNVGFQTATLNVGSQTDVTISLKEDVTGLTDVVVVGYGTQKKATVSGAVVSIKGEELDIAPVANASNALGGRLAGVTTLQRSGEPGADGASVRIRGVNTLGNNDPLVVVDGVPGRSLERIDPSTVESISVLKDASAAIYGSSAANGVILITTKRGKTGKPQVIFDFNQGFNQPTRIPKMASAAEYATMLNETDTYRGLAPRYTAADITKFTDGSDPWKYPNTNFFKEVLKPWSNQNKINASLSGGSDRMNYYISVGSIFQDGFYKNSGTFYKQYDFRSNLDGKISENVKIRFDLAGRMEYRNYPTRGSGNIFRMVMRGKPIFPGYWPDGTPGPDLEYGDNPVVVSTDATGYDRDKRYNLNSNVKLDINIPWVKGLSISSNVGLDKQFYFDKRFETPWYLYSWDGQTYDANKKPVLIRGKKGFEDPRLTESMQDNQTLLINGLVNYERSFKKHNLKLLAAVESIVGKGENFNAYKRYFISTAIDQMFAGGDLDKNAGGSGYQNARQNYFGRVNYNYSEKLLVEFVWRYDGSYIFPKKDRFGFFPGVSLGWRLSEEKFWKDNLSFIENFKIRGSWGKTGNDRIDPWQYLSTYGMNINGYTYIFGTDQQNRLLSESRIPNVNVTWEVANQADLGIEGQLFNNKIFFTFDVFDNRRSNILWRRNASVPGSTGLTLPRENIGRTKNQGFDLSLGYQNQTNRFKYSISFNGGYSKNQILFWDEAPGAPDWQRSTGKPIPSDPNNVANDLYYEAIGIFKDQKAIDDYPHWSSARPGDVIFKDVNDDKKIDGNDRVRNAKNNIPRFTGGLNFKLSYKQFDLSVLLQGAAGAVQYIKTESGEIGNYLKEYYDNRWTLQNPTASGPRTNISTAEYWDNRNTYFLHNSDYMRLKNLEFSYSLPANVNKFLGITRARVYVSGYNLLTYSPDLANFDPEMTDVQGQSYPVQKVINAGINLIF